MKKILALIIAVMMLLLSACGDFSTDGGTDNTIKPHTHYDNNHDGGCDVCGTAVVCPHTDEDEDNLCDYCREAMLGSCTVHFDGNNDKKCDACGADVKSACKEHTDADGDKKCDACGADVTIVCTAHTDADKDGVCDGCSISVVIVLDFYAMNDTHGKFANSDEFTGVDELTTYLKNAYATDDNTVILSSGDMWQGAAESNLTKGFIMTDWMNELDFVSMTLGNHEFDWGSEYIELNAEIAEFPMLAINVYEHATGEIAPYCEPSVMIERDGTKIGIIGAIGDCYSSISASRVTDVYFKTGDELTSLVKEESKRLRAQGAELIVYSLHDSYNGYDTSLSNGYVDLVFEGHTHQSYVRSDSYGVYHLQTGGDDSGIAHVELALNFVTDEYSISVVDIVDSYEYQSLADDPIVETLLKKYEAELSIAQKYLGTNLAYRSDSYIEQKVADLYYQYGVEKWGEEYDIVLGGGYLKTRSPYDLAAGDVYYGDILNILPFDNDIVLCSISGYNLKYNFFQTSNADYYISYGDYGASVKNNINTSATYYVVVDSYTLDYAYNGLTYVDTLASATYARDLLAEYIEAGGLGMGADAGDDIPSYTLTPIATILDLLDTMDYNVNTPEYYVKGTIVSIASTKYGNCTIRDEDGDEIYVYGLYDRSGNRYDSMTDKPAVGDTVVLYAAAKYYRKDDTSTPIKELMSATIIETVETE